MEVDMPDAINLLETDHREVEDLFAKAEANSGAAKSQVVNKICQELTIHAQIEEQVIYPAMRAVGLDHLIDEAEQEHQKVKELVARLEGMDSATAEADATLAELKADVSHHVEEEESTTFPRFRRAVDQNRLDDLGNQLRQAKQDAMTNS
jgi:iron-sulfur cluster repair protein YtfE (RIC family)